jgi:ABC-2 type transport system ATP-binding protein
MRSAITAASLRKSFGALRVAGHDLAADPDAVRAAIGVTGHFTAVANLLKPAGARGQPGLWSY